jgi:hypothetical protein
MRQAFLLDMKIRMERHDLATVYGPIACDFDRIWERARRSRMLSIYMETSTTRRPERMFRSTPAQRSFHVPGWSPQLF